MAETISSYELSLNDAYFIAHPEKVAGMQVEGSGWLNPVITKGTKEDVLAMFSFLENLKPENDKIKAAARAKALALALELEMEM